jgi:hypothetical protein
MSIWVTGECRPHGLIYLADKAEYAVMNFTPTASGGYGAQATLPEIESFMTITTNYMKSQDWLERFFFFGAMYEMVSYAALPFHASLS